MDSAADPVTGAPLGYRSAGLAAMLEVFALWGSSDFITTITRDTAPGLDATSVTALTLLGRHGAMRPSVLAQKLRVGASNVSKVTRRLSEDGFVERGTDTADGRAGLLQLTGRGNEVVAGFVDAGDRMMRAIQADWTQADRDRFTELLTTFHTDALHFSMAQYRKGESS
ncbi:MarR family transcriptional regulator [Arthrobacter echini]|uniref:MarR family transcriptional regulator n=1 Tax=Arthrobacter echini TaxID=1529066 RepID=A0A4S5E156_9MICC|nr:MarR family transcriptional regulator [Arthrobacter echini]THJ65057.1 MarR family transcriptional regulator [Arthrobacter echini]